ncbi:TMV resistance protein N-like isoform X2 [Ziziphus jujuba]|nr:TMV resistance protein N-like isoform X2 [Ziziphus jujuba]XP_060673781.1 TMV resistance protein N-like isoform X2 [Ziziphus jujuba]
MTRDSRSGGLHFSVYDNHNGMTSRVNIQSYVVNMSSFSLPSAVSPQQTHEFQEKYHVFLSFRGEDTRDQFASYLYAALSAKHISTFMDHHELERGDEISSTLSKAIQESKISIVIFSENYASSTWCLDELLQILKCRRTNGQIVMPIFYGIDPSTVRKQKGSYGDAFAQLEQRFKNRIEKVHQWRAALVEASNLCGLDSKDFRPETKLVQRIVEDIVLELPKYLSSNHHFKGHLVGIEGKVKEIESLLSIGLKDVRIIGIWGMGGIGKTTLASVVYQRLSYSQFEGCCFLRNVREEYARHGPNHLRKQLLSKLLNDEAILQMDTTIIDSPFILDRLRCRKVLIVLDDVDTLIQLDALIEGCNELAPESRMIVTTRNKQVLKKVADHIYKVDGLNDIESLELFRLHAFGKHSPAMDNDLVLEATSYASGHPLALKVLGSFLCSRSKTEWQSALMRLRRFPNPEIQDVLRISYEGLDDKKMKDMFLDIACLFNSSFKSDQVERMSDDCNSSVKIEISVLIDKSLIENIKGHEDNELWMHDLLRQMGRAIVRDVDNEPGNRSRLWDTMEVCKVLENSTGTMAVEVILLDVSIMKRNVKVCRGAFSNMRNLRILKIYYRNDIVGNDFKPNIIGGVNFKLSIPRNLDSYLSNKLRYLQWDLYPLKLLPSNFVPENLVELVLRGSHVEKLWNNRKDPAFPVLRRMNFSHSRFLTQLPDMLQSPNLESINLEGCTSLVQVLSSLQNLDKLTFLNLNGCSKLRYIFKEMSKRTDGFWDVVSFGGIKNVLNNFTNLKSCIQSFTSNLCLYSSSQTHISQKFAPNLRHLLMRETAIETLPPSIGCLSGLVKLDLGFCKRLKSLPRSICLMKSLEELDLFGCEKLKTFPEILEPMEHLKLLLLDYSGIKELPESIENLVSIRDLYLTQCKDLEFLPNNLCKLRNLERLWLEACSKFQHFPSLPPSLLDLSVSGCEKLKSLPELPSQCLSLSANGCMSLESISNWRAPLLKDLDIMGNRFSSGHIDFFGCDKLDENTSNIVLADHVAIKILSRVKVGRTDLHSHFRYTGDQIPKWFSYRTCGTSINNIMLPPYWNNDDFLGFAFCFVLRGNKIDPYTCRGIDVKLIFRTIDDNRLYGYSGCTGYLWDYNKAFSSDHVVIWFIGKLSLQSEGRLNWPFVCNTEAFVHVCPAYFDKSFDHVNNIEIEYGEIKKFGVRFVYNQDIERCDAETERKNKRSFHECCESSGSTEAIGLLEEEDDDESHSKKLKFM